MQHSQSCSRVEHPPSLTCLPRDVLSLVFRGQTVEQLLRLQCVCRYFLSIIRQNAETYPSLRARKIVHNVARGLCEADTVSLPPQTKDYCHNQTKATCVCGDQLCDLVLIDLWTGRQLHRTTLNQPVAAFEMDETHLYVLQRDGRFLQFDLNTYQSIHQQVNSGVELCLLKDYALIRLNETTYEVYSTAGLEKRDNLRISGNPVSIGENDDNYLLTQTDAGLEIHDLGTRLLTRYPLIGVAKQANVRKKILYLRVWDAGQSQEWLQAFNPRTQESRSYPKLRAADDQRAFMHLLNEYALVVPLFGRGSIHILDEHTGRIKEVPAWTIPAVHYPNDFCRPLADGRITRAGWGENSRLTTIKIIDFGFNLSDRPWNLRRNLTHIRKSCGLGVVAGTSGLIAVAILVMLNRRPNQFCKENSHRYTSNCTPMPSYLEKINNARIVFNVAVSVAFCFFAFVYIQRCRYQRALVRKPKH